MQFSRAQTDNVPLNEKLLSRLMRTMITRFSIELWNRYSFAMTAMPPLRSAWIQIAC